MGETAEIDWFPNNVSVCWMFFSYCKGSYHGSYRHQRLYNTVLEKVKQYYLAKHNE